MGWHFLKVWLKNGRSLTLKSDKGPSTQEQLSKSKSGGSAVVVHQWRALTPELDLPVYQSCCCYRTTLNWGVRWMPPSSRLKLGVPNPWRKYLLALRDRGRHFWQLWQAQWMLALAAKRLRQTKVMEPENDPIDRQGPWSSRMTGAWRLTKVPAHKSSLAKAKVELSEFTRIKMEPALCSATV